jgi:hypothetical protein
LHFSCLETPHWSCILYFLEGVDGNMVPAMHSPLLKRFWFCSAHLRSESIKNVILFSFETTFW